MKSSNTKEVFITFIIILSLVTVLLLFNNILLSQTPNFTRARPVGETEKNYQRSNASIEQDEKFSTNLTESTSNWQAAITVNSNGMTFPLAFAGNINATDGFDTGLDVPAAPPGMTYYAYFETAQFPNYLSTDARAWVGSYNTNIDWTLKIVNASNKTSTVSWNPTDLPTEGTFMLEGTSLSVDMKTQSSATVNGDQALKIQYRPAAGQQWSVPLTINSNSINLLLSFGGDPKATDGFDAGLDAPAAPPGMTYYAYWEISQFPNFLSTDMRGWISPYTAEISWALKIVNAANTTSTISWNPDNLPPQGTFTLEGLTSPVDMRTQSSVTFSGDKTLTIKYRFKTASILVVAPNGGEAWAIGSTQNITWTCTDFIDPVKIEYSTDGGTTWIAPPIVNTTPNDGLHPWVIPNTPSVKCKVRISDAADGDPLDISDKDFAIGDVVDIYPPVDTTGSANSIIKIPIYVRDVTNKGILSVSLTVNTLPEVLKPLGASSEGTIASSWGSPTAGITGGDITIGMAGTSPLTGNGQQILVYIRYQVGNTLGAENTISITKAMFNEGQPMARITSTGKFKIVSKFNMAGKVSYYYNVQLVPRALMSLTGYDSMSTTTDTLGSYRFADLPGGNYVLKSFKTKDVHNAISAYDASLVLRYSVGSITLTPYQKIAADVSGNGDVTSYDASYILRYCVGLVSQFLVGKDWKLTPKNFPIDDTNWRMAPDSMTFKPLNSDVADQDFFGIVYGDVSGNWPGTTVSGSNVAVKLNIGTIQKTPQGKWLVPLDMSFVEPAYSGNFMMKFNGSNLRFVSSSNTNTNIELLHATATCATGVNCAFAAAQSLTSQSAIINFIFDELHPLTPLPGDFELANIIVDDKAAIITKVENLNELQIPTEWRLSQNHPNPFNAETIISYQVPEAAQVKIEIFNLLGQRLKTLVNGNEKPGTYKISWNGKDEQGRLAGSGIYICRMQAREFQAVKKMVLIQ